MVIDKTLLVLEAMLDCILHRCPHVSIDACLRLKTRMRYYCKVHKIACNLLTSSEPRKLQGASSIFDSLRAFFILLMC